MTTKRTTRHVLTLAVAAALAGCESGGSTTSTTPAGSSGSPAAGSSAGAGSGGAMGVAGALFNQLGGMDGVSKLASSYLGSASKNPQLSGLLGNADTSAMTPKLTDQLCATLGGGCTAPLTDTQIQAGATKITPEQNKALTDTLGDTLKSLGTSPAATSAINSVLGPKIGGIVGALAGSL